jgi:hypothetical protein
MHFTVTTLDIYEATKSLILVGTYDDTGEAINKTETTYKLINLHRLVDHLYSFKPVGNDAVNEYSTINISVGVNATYTPKDGSASWTINYADIKEYLIYLLAEEIILIP